MSDALPPPEPTHDAPFTRMAQKIVDNLSNGFAGAFVIVAPDGSHHDLLVLDSHASPSLFWSAVKVRVDIALAELDDVERRGGRF